MTDNQSELDALRDRVAQLEEQQEKLIQGAVDAQGRNWSVSDFLNLGLSRRQALTAVAAIASGATIGGALREAVGAASAGPSTSDTDGDVGMPSNRVDLFADGVDANDLDIGGNDFVSVGDVVPVMTITPHQQSDSFTTATYGANNGFYRQQLSIGALVSDGATIVARIQGVVVPGTDESVDVRLRNSTARETLAEVTNISSTTTFNSGWSTYNPSAPDSSDYYVVERLTDPGSNSSEIRAFFGSIAVQM
jgi:hypothetical protein